MNKPRKLMPKEKEMLRSLENEARKKEQILESKTAEVRAGTDKRIHEAAEVATGRVRDAAERFKSAKKKLDQKRAAALNRVQRDFQKELDLLHAEKTGVCQAAESWLESDKHEAEREFQKEKTKLDTEFQKFLVENRAERDRIKMGEKKPAKATA